MNPRICICCGGEVQGQRRDALPPNPNMCAPCANPAEGVEELEDLEPVVMLPEPLAYELTWD